MIEESMPSAKARVAAFHCKHGGICFSDGVHWFYPDGAYRDVNPLGVLAEPSDLSTREGEHRNALNVVSFYQLKFKAAAAEFDQFNYRLSVTLPANGEHALAELERLRSAVEQCKKEVAVAEEKLAATEIQRFRNGRRKAEEEERQRWHEFQQKRQAIRI